MDTRVPTLKEVIKVMTILTKRILVRIMKVLVINRAVAKVLEKFSFSEKKKNKNIPESSEIVVKII